MEISRSKPAAVQPVVTNRENPVAIPVLRPEIDQPQISGTLEKKPESSGAPAQGPAKADCAKTNAKPDVGIYGRRNRKAHGDDVDFVCPHCGEIYFAKRSEINCTIFRCGYANGQAFPPHASQQQCAELLKIPNSRGCGKPFRFDGQRAQPCPYI
jgi:hypothetical protein